MSLDLELRGQTASIWPLSISCLGQIERLSEADPEFTHAIETIFGSEETEAGAWRSIGREDLLQAVDELIPPAKRLPSGFRMAVPPIAGGTLPTVGSGGISGVLIQGAYHYINCDHGDYWTIQLTEEMRKGIEPVRRYEPAEIQTENLGVIKIEAKPSRRSDLLKLLRDIRKFLEMDLSETFQVVLG